MNLVRIDVAQPADFVEILRIWAEELAEDWIGDDRFYNGLLCDPLFTGRSLWVARELNQVVGFVLLSAVVDGQIKLGAIAVSKRWQEKGIGSRLWAAAITNARTGQAGTLLVKGLFPYNFIPGIDTDRHVRAHAWFMAKGCLQGQSVVAMAKSLDETPILSCTNSPRRLDHSVRLGVLPPELRNLALETVQSEFGAGWARAIRETWLQEKAPARVLGIFSPTQIFGISVVGGFGEPIGRLGPIGVIAEARGRGWGEELLRFALSYMRTHHALHAFFLHCDVGTPAYHMYLANGFQITRTFMPLHYPLHD